MNMSPDALANLSAVASVATAIGALAAAWQLFLVHRQSVTNFEDAFAKEYRELAAKLPTKALLGEPLTDVEHDEHFDEMYHYFDLCNEQAFLKSAGRISEKTWTFWLDGMSKNMRRPAFSKAWEEIASRSSGDFSELRALYPPKKIESQANADA
ncbi:MAG TPA: hypothetical protein VLC92_14465 [Rhodocyclaceae bacterium]|nr:hypothetical protein [Rhodocyclaceae bacterium]